MKHAKTLSKLCIALGAIAMVFVTIAAYGGPKVDKAGVIDCYNNTFVSLGETDPKKNEVHESKKMTWYLFGAEDTKVEIKFAPDSNYPDCKGTSPFDPGKKLEETIDHSYKLDKLESGNVLKGMGSTDPSVPNCYVYQVVCTPPASYTGSSQSKSMDPIIEVPK
jgi:hypothetical protein